MTNDEDRGPDWPPVYDLPLRREIHRRRACVEQLFRIDKTDPTVHCFLHGWQHGSFSSFEEMLCQLAVQLATEKAAYMDTAVRAVESQIPKSLNPQIPSAPMLDLDLDNDADAREAMYCYARAIEAERPDRARKILRLVARTSTAEECRRRYAELQCPGLSTPEQRAEAADAIGARWPEKAHAEWLKRSKACRPAAIKREAKKKR